MSRTSASRLKIRVGDQVPSIGLRASDGFLLNLRSFVTKRPVALCFFGAATMQGAARRTGHKLSEALAAGYERLREAGIEVVGITCDNERQQIEYIRERNLPYLLFSDERRSAVDILGIPTVNQGDNYNVAQPVIVAVDIDGTVRSILERPAADEVVGAIIRAFAEPLPTAPSTAAPTERAPRRRAQAPDDRPASDKVGQVPEPATGSADPSAPAKTSEEGGTDPHLEPPATQRGPSPLDPQVPER